MDPLLNSSPNDKPCFSSRPVIRLIGVGGAGCKAADYLYQEELKEVDFHLVHTNSQILAQTSISNKWVFGAQRLRGLGAGGDPEVSRNVADEEQQLIQSIIQGADIVFLLTGLGGGTGTGISPVIARAARENGALVLCFSLLPFHFEGKRRQDQAVAGLQQLKMAADGVITLPNDRMLALINDNTSVLETFSIINEHLARAVKGLWRMVTQQGLIPVDFSDLQALLRNRHAESSFASTEARGSNRAREAVEKLLSSPLLQKGQLLDSAEGVLVSIAGGRDLTMTDVQWVMDHLTRHCDTAQVVMGASVLDDFNDRLEVTVVATQKGHLPSASRNSWQELNVESSKTSNTPVSDQETPPDSSLTSAAEEHAFDTQFLNPKEISHGTSRFVAPPPELTEEKAKQLMKQRAAGGLKRKALARWRQGQLPLEIVSKGRFEKSEPTIYRGEDLDVPTYIRRGIPLN